MSLFISSIASGSNGNCYYVGTASEAVLIDAGLSCREIEKRMGRLGLSLQNVKAVFISHEHSDHIYGLPVLVKKWQIPVYITTDTMRNGRLSLHGYPVHTFRQNETITIGNLTISSFSKAHDAADPHSFVVTHQGVKVGVFTDIGVPCAQLIRHFKECHAAFLEANYDEQMLAKGHYPTYLKARISGGKGHLSNRQALELFNAHRPSFMSHLVLAHLSKNNNCPQLVEELFQRYAGTTTIAIASRHVESPVYHIQQVEGTSVTSVLPAHYNVAVSQLAFSF
jgi:phosphoribosyl 1,2-cyclic phosphodiesterase